MSPNRRRGAQVLAYLVVTAVACLAAHAAAMRWAVQSLQGSNTGRMEAYLASLRSEMRRYEYLPTVVSLDEDVQRLLARPDDEALRAAVNRRLETVNRLAGASAVYVMDPDGRTLSASNWNEADSFVDRNYGFRPYFQDAIRGEPGRFYGIGTVSRLPGYYFAHGVRQGSSVAGVVTVKVDLESLDDAWGQGNEKILVVDGNGVVFLSSEAGWKFRTVGELSQDTVARLTETRQYWQAGFLTPLGLRERRPFDDNADLVHYDGGVQGTGNAADFLLQSRGVEGTPWRLLMMTPLATAQASARTAVVVTAMCSGLFALLALYLRQRRRIAEQARASRRALQRANDELESKVQARTEALSESNLQLQTEVAERQRAEQSLKETMAELIHTAKMAALGQMSAGITHELNQPLAALRTLSANTVAFFERGNVDQAKANLGVIAQLADKMGRITSQLKKFAHKSAPQMQPVLLDTAITDVLFLLGQGKRTQGVVIERTTDVPGLRALCDGGRLEQVLLNLLTNALDAVEGRIEPRITVVVRAEGDAALVEVHDSGGGLSPHVRGRLFEPFVTTKPQGLGLGLGLAISSTIVKELGGQLVAGDSELLGGAVFTVRLQAAGVENPSSRLELHA